MKLLDQYILKKLLGTFVFTVLLIVVVVLVFHMSDHVEKFVREGVSTSEIIGYYLDFVPWMANSLTPLTVFIATVFVTAQLAGRTEIVAMLSSGVSFSRFLRPYLIGALIIAAVSFMLNSWVIPKGNKSRTEFEVRYFKKKSPFIKTDMHFQTAKNTYTYMRAFNNDRNTGYKFTTEKVKGTEVLEKLSADSVSWLEEEKKWRLYNCKIHGFENDDESLAKAAYIDAFLDIHPKDFKNTYKNQEALTLVELDEEIKKLKLRGSLEVINYEIEKYIRYTAPFAILILCMLGVVISSKKSRGGTGYQIALGFLLCFVYIICFTFSKAVAENGGFGGVFGPYFSIWLPNILFLLITIGIYRYVPK